MSLIGDVPGKEAIEPPLAAELNKLDKSVVELHSVFDNFAEQLVPVLGGSNPTGDANEKTAGSVGSSPMADKVFNIERSVSHVIEKLQDVYSRLEV